jgi:hypothetical protein
MAQRQRIAPTQTLHGTAAQQQQDKAVARGQKALRRFPGFDRLRREEVLDSYEAQARAEEQNTAPEEEDLASEEDVLFLTEGGDEADAVFEQTVQDEGEEAVSEPEELFRETPEFFGAKLHPVWIHFRGKLLWGASARTIGRTLRSRMKELEAMRRGLETLLAALNETVHPLFADASPEKCRGLLQASWFFTKNTEDGESTLDWGSSESATQTPKGQDGTKAETSESEGALHLQHAAEDQDTADAEDVGNAKKARNTSEKNQAPALLEKIKDLAIWDLDHPERPFLPLGELFVLQGSGGDKTHLELRWLREELRARGMRLEEELAPGRRFWFRNKTWLPGAYNDFFLRLGQALKDAFALKKNPFKPVTKSTLKETRLDRWKEIFAALDTDMPGPEHGRLSDKGKNEEKSGRRGRRKATVEDAAPETTQKRTDGEGGAGA